MLRPNHSILDNLSFAEKVIDSIRRVSDQLKRNWQATSAFSVFTSLVTHLLSISSHRHIRQKFWDFLELARVVTLDWTLQLKDKVQRSTEIVTRDSFRAKAAAVAPVFAQGPLM